jgi:hypothetical protein
MRNIILNEINSNNRKSLAMSEALGIMDEGYFVSRREILRWINHTLSLELTAI